MFSLSNPDLLISRVMVARFKHNITDWAIGVFIMAFINDKCKSTHFFKCQIGSGTKSHDLFWDLGDYLLDFNHRNISRIFHRIQYVIIDKYHHYCTLYCLFIYRNFLINRQSLRHIFQGLLHSQEAFVTVVHVFVTSCIDYCNSLLYGISDYNINHLEQIQNSGAHIVTNTQK